MRFLRLVGTTVVSILLLASCHQAETLTAFTPPPNALDREFIEGINPPQYFEYLDEGENDIHPAVVMLTDECGRMIASGVLIEPNVVLTAAHCLDDNEDIFGVTNGIEDVMVKKIIPHKNYHGWNGSYDIGLLILECDMSAKPIPLWQGGDVPRLADITTVGYGAGYKKWSKKDTYCYYGTIVEEPWFIKFLPIYGPVWHGDSGGAVIYDGKLIGIISSYTIHLSNSDLNIIECNATSIRMYKHWIEEVLKNEKLDKRPSIFVDDPIGGRSWLN